MKQNDHSDLSIVLINNKSIDPSAGPSVHNSQSRVQNGEVQI